MLPFVAFVVVSAWSIIASAEDSALRSQPAAARTDSAPAVNLPPSASCLEVLNSADPQPAPDLDTLRQQVLALFTNKCANCHQLDVSHAERKIKKYGNILKIDEMESSKYISPGKPGGSILFNKICTGEMPKRDDNADPFDAKVIENSIVTEAEIRSVRQWILALDETAPAAVADNGAAPPKPQGDQRAPTAPPTPPAAADKTPAQSPPFVSNADIYEFIGQDLDRCLAATPDNCKNYRYLTLTHFLNAGVPARTIATYRQAVFKLLNALSTSHQIYALEKIGDSPLGTVDPYGTIIRVDLGAINWSAAIWDEIASHDPYAFDLSTHSSFGYIQTQTDTKTPTLRADWFAKAAARPPLYYKILGLPDTLDALETSLNVHRLDDIRNHLPSKISRDAFKTSGVSDHNRLIEKHDSSSGFYWISYDFSSDERAQKKDLEQFPLGPGDIFPGITGFVHDGGEVIYELPNGMHAYYLTRATGERLEAGPLTIVHDKTATRGDGSVVAGLSCMGCHAAGMRLPDDPQTRIHERSNMTQEEKTIFRELFPGGAVIDATLTKEQREYLQTLTDAGALDAGTDAAQVEDPINKLVEKFDDPLTRKRAAAELGLTPDDFKNRVDQLPDTPEGSEVKNDYHLLTDSVGDSRFPREQFISVFRRFVTALKLGTARDFDPLRDPLPATATTTPPATDPNKDYCLAAASTENARQAGINGLTSYVQRCAAIAPDIVPGIRAEIAELTAYQTASACLAAGNACTNGAACVSAYIASFPSGQHRSQIEASLTNPQADCQELGAYQTANACLAAGNACTNGATCVSGYVSAFPGGQHRSALESLLSSRTSECGSFDSYRGIDFTGDNLRNPPFIYNQSFNSCSDLCAADVGCVAFTFNTRRSVCIPKSAVGTTTYSNQAISAARHGLTVPKPASNMEIQGGVDYFGGDFTNDPIRSISQDECSERCESDSQCKAFTYVTAIRQCWLKGSVPPPQQKRGLVSGVKLGVN